MPGLVQRSVSQFGNATAGTCSPPVAASGSVLPNGVWSKQRDDIGFDQLQKFWSELLPHARQELLRIDKHTLFEQARKNLYCSRCNGLLLEGFTQIVMYGKSLQREAGVAYLHNKIGDMENDQEKESDEAQDPSVHPWGGLVASRDGTLTLMDCYLYGKSLWVLQNVFDSARARERERELLYPDACGGGGRGWISHGMANYGRVHGVRETCALHTARLSCDTLVDFWSALGDETRLSLLRMKEEDFIERLMYRFDSKRFCRDCRKNVIREFKELKELKRMRRQTRCTSWFCVADTAFQYEVSKDTVQADWRHSFADSAGTYHHFEWAIGTSEGKSDILEFEDAGLTGEVQVNGVELEGLDACFITLRAWRLDGRCTELTVKAHALKGKPCVHQRLVVGDGFVTITKGENIRSFFERAEEAEEEEDDDPIDKDGNELDGDGSRPQKHAKSPELAREFLLDAATVIFKEQVEKAFREGTARQNAHSIFVCLALKLLEERVHVACKEIITLEKQVKLLEEEEKEKREEEERRERRRAKEREKKLRRKERLRGKEREKERKDCESDSLSAVVVSKKESSASAHEKTPKILDEVDPNNEAGGCITASALSGDTVEEQFPNGSASSESGDLNNAFHSVHDGEMDGSDTNGSFILEQSKSFRRKLRFNQNLLSEQANEWSGKHKSAIGNENNIPPGESETTPNGYSITSSRCISGGHRHSRANIVKTNARNCGLRFSEKFHSSKSRIRERYDYHYCSCNQHVDYRAKDSHFISTVRSGREIKAMNTTETPLDASRSVFHSSKYSYGSHASDNSVTPKPKIVLANSNILRTKKVWEPTDSRKKCFRNESDPSPGSRTPKIDSPEQNGCTVAQNAHKEPHVVLSESCLSIESSKPGSVQHDDCSTKTSDSNAGAGNLNDCSDAFHLETKSCYYKDVGDEEVDSCSVSPTSPMDNHCDPLLSSSSSDNCSSCLSEADSSSSSSTARNAESSSTSDSEDVSPQFEGRDAPICNENVFLTSQEGNDKDSGASFSGRTMLGLPFDSCSQPNILRGSSIKDFCNSDSSLYGCEMAHRQQQVLPMHNHNLHSSYVPFPTMSYHNQNPASWSATADNGVLSFAQPHHYLFPSSIGYGLPANQPPDFCLPYSGLQPLATPMLSVRHPVYQTVKQVNIHNSNEQMKNFKVGGDQQGNGMTNAKKSAQTLERPMLHSQQSKPQSTDENVNDGASSKLDKEIPSFSLFHFGGPVAVASGNNLDSLSLKNESTQEAETDNACLKKDIAVEEYSLFASRNGSRFSFF